LDVHVLDRCRDHGVDGFKRCIALAVVARNIQRIGAQLWAQEVEEARRERDRQRRRRAV
jgi:transposase, IS5 family